MSLGMSSAFLSFVEFLFVHSALKKYVRSLYKDLFVAPDWVKIVFHTMYKWLMIHIQFQQSLTTLRDVHYTSENYSYIYTKMSESQLMITPVALKSISFHTCFKI